MSAEVGRLRRIAVPSNVNSSKVPVIRSPACKTVPSKRRIATAVNPFGEKVAVPVLVEETIPFTAMPAVIAVGAGVSVAVKAFAVPVNVPAQSHPPPCAFDAATTWRALTNCDSRAAILPSSLTFEGP